MTAAHLAAILSWPDATPGGDHPASPATEPVTGLATARAGTASLVNRTGTAPTVAMTTSPAGGHLAAAVSQTASPEISLPSVRSELTPKLTPNAPTSRRPPKSPSPAVASTADPSLGVPVA